MNPYWYAVPAALGLSAWLTARLTAYGASSPRSQLFGKTICYTNSPEKLALTFDDGPNPAITPKLLDLLERYDAHATFFLVGRFVRQCPDLVHEISARGHIIGNHTETHPNLFWRRPRQIRDELRQCHEAIIAAINVPPKWFRPPFGARNPWVAVAARELDLRVVMWSLIAMDWLVRPPELLINSMQPIATRAQKQLQPGSLPTGTRGDIVCLHDGDDRQLNGDRSCTLLALEHWLPRWRDLGLKFVTIEEAVSTPTP